MFISDLERFGSFDLQFFAPDEGGEPAPGPSETPSDSTEPTGDEPTTDPDDESFIDESLLPDEVKQSAHFKGMKSAYTKKTQEIAEVKKVLKEHGLTAQQAAVLLKRLQEDPHGLAEIIKPTKKTQEQQEPQEPTHDDLGEFADDEYALKLIEAAEKRTLTKAEQKIVDAVMKKLGPQLQTVESIQRREAMEFKKQVDDSIKKVLKDFPDAKLTHDQLFKIAARHEIEPADMENALAIALGPTKYRELISKKALADASKKIQDNHESVGPVMGSGDGGTDKAPFNGPPSSFDEATARALKKYGG